MRGATGSSGAPTSSQIPRDAPFFPDTKEIKKPNKLHGGVDTNKATGYALKMNSPTAVRALNALLGSGVPAQLALGPFTAANGATLPAGSAVFAADNATRNLLDGVGKDNERHVRRRRGRSAGP